MLTRRRAAASVSLLPTAYLEDETAAFDLLVNGVYGGHWAETSMSRASVMWTGGSSIETEPCDGDEKKIIAAVRPTIPAPLLGLEKAHTPPNYDPVQVGAVLLHEVIEQYPARLTVEGLVLQIVTDPEDEREIRVALAAIRELREWGLVRYREEEKIVKATRTALRGYTLLTAV